MRDNTLTVALISDVFHADDAATRLRSRLSEAKSRGAALAVLPELPLNPWSPATKISRDDDAEPPNGPRVALQSQLAREVGIGLVGGAIVRDPATGRRRNTALVFDATGHLVSTYSKLHLPEEPGFWETSHYEPGDRAAAVVDGFALTFGVQICSDINRPEGAHLLGAMGAEAILAPRATEQRTYPRWRIVFQANALTSCAYALSVNRPGPEPAGDGLTIGGPSVAVAPDGQLILETADPVGVVTLHRSVVEQARRDYPGYLPIRADLYASAWSAVARASSAKAP